MTSLAPMSAAPAQAVFYADEARKRKVTRATKGQGPYDGTLPRILYGGAALSLIVAVAATVVLVLAMQSSSKWFMSSYREDVVISAATAIVIALAAALVLFLCGRIQQKHKTLLRSGECVWLAGGFLWYAWHRPLDADTVAGPDGGVMSVRTASVNVVAIELGATTVSLDDEGYFVFRGGIRGSYFEEGVPGALTPQMLGYDPRSQEMRIGDYFGADLRQFAGNEFQAR